jgi:pyrroline-5-carboxylate reductase
VGGLVAREVPPASLQVGEPLPDVRAALARDYGVTTTADNALAIADADVVVLAVKPQEMRGVAGALAPALARGRPVVVSIAAGVRCAALARWCGPGVPIVRAMPNRPALVGAGITGLHAAPGVTDSQRALAESVLRAVGDIVWVPDEALLDVVTAVSGSGPAYFFRLAEHLASAGTRLGLQPETAQRLAAATLQGAGALARASDGDLARLTREVTSRGGTTEAALLSLEAAGFGDHVAAAVQAAAERGTQLAREFGTEP